jgi:fibronectin type 3 domain-containing protein
VKRFPLSKKQLILILIFILLFTVLFAFYQAEKNAKIRLAWDPSFTPNVLGYKIYYGKASKIYDKSIKVGNVNTYTLRGLNRGQTYYIAATAYDKSGRESHFSNEVKGVALAGE